MKFFSTLCPGLAIFALASLGMNEAHADGFRCQTEKGGLRARVYNHVAAKNGTRKAALLVLSSQAEAYGSRTIARFSFSKGTLRSYGTSYVLSILDPNEVAAEIVSPRAPILGVSLSSILQIELDIFFTYSSPVRHGQAVRGEFAILTKDGRVVREPVNCTRYLKTSR
jgi:hypothetical protein